MSGKAKPEANNGNIFARALTQHGKQFVKGVFILHHSVGRLSAAADFVLDRRAADSRPYGVDFHLSENKPRAHLHRRMVVSKCALLILGLKNY